MPTYSLNYRTCGPKQETLQMLEGLRYLKSSRNLPSRELALWQVGVDVEVRLYQPEILI